MNDPLNQTRATIAAYEIALAEVQSEQLQLAAIATRIRNLQTRESWYCRVLTELRAIEAKSEDLQHKEQASGN